MRVGIMQPYFLPYLGYFSLIKHTDQFILFEPVQFIRHGWIERNRILKPNEGWSYISVPLNKRSRETLIKDIRIDNTKDWKSTIFRQLEHYKKKSPYYKETIEVLQDAFNIETDSIVILNQHVLQTICKYLGFEREMPIFSDMNVRIESPTAPDEWALNICKALGNVKEYWNPIGGIDFFDKSKYDDANIELLFQGVNITPYVQKRGYFEPGLSIIDVMMFNSPKEINDMLDNYYFLEYEKEKAHVNKK